MTYSMLIPSRNHQLESLPQPAPRYLTGPTGRSGLTIKTTLFTYVRIKRSPDFN